MLVQTYFPQRLSPVRYDAFLASGWFRGSVMLYKMDLLCLEGDLCSVVNIRLNLDRHSWTKKQRKTIRRVEGQFSYTHGPASTDPAKEQLYSRQKKRFKGFIHPTLEDYLNAQLKEVVFDTREVCVFDGTKLIAVSYFDCGAKSLASLLGLYDEGYAKYSLGIYTMLKEMEYGILNGYRWFYPGYVLDQSSQFNYKLTLGDFEYYNARKRWANFEHFDPSETKGAQIKEEVKKLSELLREEDLEFKEILYPLFSMGYIGYWNAEFVKYPLFLSVITKHQEEVIFAYDIDMEAYVVNRVVEAKDYEHLINMEASDDFRTDSAYLMRLLMVSEHILIAGTNEDEMLKAYIRQLK